MTTTLILIGELATTVAQDWQIWGEDHDTTGSGGGVLGSIPGVPMFNDGRHDYWLPPSGAVVLTHHDGSAWAVEHPAAYWAGHELLIIARQLPMASGLHRATLLPGEVYEIRHRQDAETRSLGWWLYRRG